MNFIEKKGNLFDIPSYTDKNGVRIAYCVTSDFDVCDNLTNHNEDNSSMRGKLLNWSAENDIMMKTKDIKHPIISRPELVGRAVKMDNTYSLITKNFMNDETNAKDFEKCIKDLKTQMTKNNEHYLAIPDMICSGTNGLDRNTVIGIIRSVFLFSSITVFAVKS